MSHLTAQREAFESICWRPKLKVLRRIEPYLPIFETNTRYLLKTVDQVGEFEEVLKLRAQVFSEEYGVNLDSSSLDVDAYDFQCDHLIIIDQSTGVIVGTYRLLCSRFANRFYSESEFEISGFLSSPGVKLELGRACIAKSHRKGAVLSLLWRGMIRYAILTQSEYLFGCSSVKTESPFEAKALHDAFTSEGSISQEWKIDSLPKFKILNFENLAGGPPTVEVPALFRSYLNAGAKVLGQPALDRDFHCVDFFTVLRLNEMAGQYEKKYQV